MPINTRHTTYDKGSVGESKDPPPKAPTKNNNTESGDLLGGVVDPDPNSNTNKTDNNTSESTVVDLTAAPTNSAESISHTSEAEIKIKAYSLHDNQHSWCIQKGQTFESTIKKQKKPTKAQQQTKCTLLQKRKKEQAAAQERANVEALIKAKVKIQEKNALVGSLKRSNTNLNKKVEKLGSLLYSAQEEKSLAKAERDCTIQDCNMAQETIKELQREVADKKRKLNTASKKIETLEVAKKKLVDQVELFKNKNLGEQYQHEKNMKELEIKLQMLENEKTAKLQDSLSERRFFEEMAKDNRQKFNQLQKEKNAAAKAKEEKEKRKSYNNRIIQSTSMTGNSVLNDEIKCLVAIKGQAPGSFHHDTNSHDKKHSHHHHHHHHKLPDKYHHRHHHHPGHHHHHHCRHHDSNSNNHHHYSDKQQQHMKK